MGLGIHQNGRRRAAGYQLFQNKAVAGILGAGVQFAVGEGTGAALAKLDVGLGIQRAVGPEPFHIRRPLLGGLTALKENGAQTCVGEHQRGEETGGPGTHHHGGDIFRGAGSGEAVELRRVAAYALVAAAAQHLGFIFDLRGHGVDEKQLFPGVHGAAQDLRAEDVRRAYAQKFGDFTRQGALILPGRQAQLVDPQHERRLLYKKFKVDGGNLKLDLSFGRIIIYIHRMLIKASYHIPAALTSVRKGKIQNLVVFSSHV